VAEVPLGEGVSSTTLPTRFHAIEALEPSRVGRGGGQITDEVISHLAGIIDACVSVTIEF